MPIPDPRRKPVRTSRPVRGSGAYGPADVEQDDYPLSEQAPSSSDSPPASGGSDSPAPSGGE